MNPFIPYIPVTLAFVPVYFVTLAMIVGTWSTYRGSHGPVILAIALYMIWTKRGLLQNMTAAPNLPCGAALTAIGCFLLVSGRLSSLLLLQYLSLIITLLGLVLLLWGTDYLKALWIPIGYLFFMFPIFSEILEPFSLYLQTIAAWIAAQLLGLWGIASFRTGTFLELPTVTLEVARECNGINHIMALVSLAIPLAYWTQKTWPRKLILIAAAFPIGVILNGFRVTIIGLYAYYRPGGPVHGPYDLFYVSFIFFFGILILLALSSAMASRGKKEREKKASAPLSAPVQPTAVSREKGPIVAAVGILLLTWGYLAFFKPQPVYLDKPIDTFPIRIGSWTGQKTEFAELPFRYFRADEELKRVYLNEKGDEISVYIGYFSSQDQDREIVHYRFDPLQTKAQTIPIRTKLGPFDIKVSNSPHDGGNAVYFWYVVNGKVLTNRYAAKIMTIRDAIFHRRTNAAIVVIGGTRSNDHRAEIGFIGEIFPIVQTRLASTL